ASLEEVQNRQYGKLSGGQQQRLHFALALVGNPDLLFLDEPTAGLDVSTRRDFWNQVSGVLEQGRTVQWTTRYLEEADARPDRLFLDEPTTGLDVSTRRDVWNQVRGFLEQGRTVLLTTHDLEEADALADRIVLIDEGKLLATGTPEEIKSRAAGKRLRFTTRLTKEAISALPDVVDVDRSGTQTVVLTSHPENVLRELLSRDESLSNLEV